MIGIDTNVLVRYFAADDPAQFRKADEFITHSRNHGVRLYVSDVALCEFVWVLRSAYKVRREKMIEVLADILSGKQFSFDDQRMLENALDDYIDGKGDFADYVIGRCDQSAGCETTVTFDRGLRDETGFRILSRRVTSLSTSSSET